MGAVVEPNPPLQKMGPISTGLLGMFGLSVARRLAKVCSDVIGALKNF